MERQAIRRTLEKYGDFLNVSQVAECLGIERKTARTKYLRGLEYIPNGKEKLYHKEDILNRIMQLRRT